MTRLAIVALTLLAPASALGEWLPAEARAIPREQSASRDAPVVELAYGPRWMLSFGIERALWRSGGWRFGFSLLVAGERLDGVSRRRISVG
jgi:hypothetical protein